MAPIQFWHGSGNYERASSGHLCLCKNTNSNHKAKDCQNDLNDTIPKAPQCNLQPLTESSPSPIPPRRPAHPRSEEETTITQAAASIDHPKSLNHPKSHNHAKSLDHPYPQSPKSQPVGLITQIATVGLITRNPSPMCNPRPQPSSNVQRRPPTN